MIRHKQFISLFALGLFSSEGTMAQDKVLADKAISVVQPILENEKTLPASNETIILGGPTKREFDSRLSAAKAEIGPQNLILADKFNACVMQSELKAQLDLHVENRIGRATSTGVRSDPAPYREDNLVSQATDVRNLITAECAAKIYGGPGGMGN